MKKILLAFLLLLTVSCTGQSKTSFSEKALADTFLSIDGGKFSFSEVLSKHKGKDILIDVWASWCHDCIKGMPKVKGLQAEFSEVVFLFLSLDKNEASWKRGIERYNVEGDHFFIPSGWKGDFCSEIKLDWIPRYMVVDKTGQIKLFKATKASSRKLYKALLETKSK